MKRFFILAALMLTISFASFGTSTAEAGHYPRCYYKTVTAYKIVKKPIVQYITKYDHCGKPYRVKIVTWKTVKIPYQKRIRVCH